MFCHLGHFFFVCLSWRICYFKGQSLRCSPGRGNAGLSAVTLYEGEGPSGSNGTRFTLLQISIFHSPTHNQTGPLWCWFPSGWACAHSRPLWVSPTTSPVRLGVSPADASTPTGVFGLKLNQRFVALFHRAVALGCAVCLLPSVGPVYLCSNVGLRCATRTLPAPLSATLSPALSVYLRECVAAGSASARTACPVRPTLRQSQSRHSHESPLHPGARLRPSYRSR